MKVILSVIWRLVINFQVLQGNDSSSQNAAALKREAKAKLLGWVQEKTGEVVHDCDRRFLSIHSLFLLKIWILFFYFLFIYLFIFYFFLIF